METIKGTVVDIFGNILDINRFPIPIGSKGLTFKTEEGENIPADVFNKIRAAERKSIAFHFELNARKDLSGKGGKISLPDINSKDDYARNRSRFFFDIDKEGLFKLNVPASSETGNIPLLTRYENNSTVSSEDNNNPNKLIFTEDGLDILHDSFARGKIDIKGENGLISPKDRISEDNIRHGTAHHSIADKFVTFMSDAPTWLDIQYNASVGLSSLPKYNQLVSPEIMCSGENAKAGGRSGSVNLDGSLELNIGANTIDRQSLWLDTAGSIIGMFGRDNNNISAAFSMDGDMIVQIGGTGLNPGGGRDDLTTGATLDSRFIKSNNAYRGGALDIRVMNDGFTVSIVRIDKDGVSIVTPNTIKMHARDITLTAEASMHFEADNIFINGRWVDKNSIISI